MKEIKGNFSGKDKKITIVISRFNELVSKQLLSGCVDTLEKSGVRSSDITVVWAPGCLPAVRDKGQGPHRRHTRN